MLLDSCHVARSLVDKVSAIAYVVVVEGAYTRVPRLLNFLFSPQILCIWRSFLGFFKGSCLREKEPTPALPYLPDYDVVAEKERVMSDEADEDLIVMRQLRKEYDEGKVAVEDMSLGIPPGECFGLLGINGEFELPQLIRL